MMNDDALVSSSSSSQVSVQMRVASVESLFLGAEKVCGDVIAAEALCCCKNLEIGCRVKIQTICLICPVFLFSDILMS